MSNARTVRLGSSLQYHSAPHTPRWQQAYVDMIDELREAGLSWVQIGTGLGVTGEAVCKRYRTIKPLPNQRDEQQLAKLGTYFELREQGLPDKEIAARMGHTRRGLERWMNRNGVSSVRSRDPDETAGDQIQ